MLLNGRGYYISNKVIEGKNGTYFYIKVCDEGNGEMEMRTEHLIQDIKKFAPITFDVEILQGQYPRYNLKSYKKVV